MNKDDFFIGWSSDVPQADRRFFLRSGLGLMAATVGLGAGLAHFQKSPGTGSWDQGDVREWTGIATADPYPLFRTIDVDGTVKTALLSCLGKCGVEARIGALGGQPVVIKGSPIRRGPHLMIAVVDGMDWISPAEGAPADVQALAMPEREQLGNVDLRGQILDSKCWFGAMSPSNGKVHKACASLCIRGGIPPVFRAIDRPGNSALMIMTDRGEAHGEELLPFVADPVTMTGSAYRFGDMLFLDSPVSNITRL